MNRIAEALKVTCNNVRCILYLFAVTFTSTILCSIYVNVSFFLLSPSNGRANKRVCAFVDLNQTGRSVGRLQWDLMHCFWITHFSLFLHSQQLLIFHTTNYFQRRFYFVVLFEFFCTFIDVFLCECVAIDYWNSNLCIEWHPFS